MLSLISVFILILVPNADSVPTDTPALTDAHTYLENSLYDVISVPSMVGCAVECSVNSACLSFGFEPGTQTCHLYTQRHRDDRREEEEELVSWPKRKTMGPCSDDDCKAGEIFTVHRATMAPQCLKVKASLLPGYCPFPAAIPNAIVSSGKQQVGSVRTYTCNHGYLDTSLDSIKAVTTCMADGHWSRVQLNCHGSFTEEMDDYWNIGYYWNAYDKCYNSSITSMVTEFLKGTHL